MRRLPTYLGCLLLFLQCTQQPRETGVEIVAKSVEAHGGWNAYNALTQISFDKTTQLFRQDGSLESELIQRQNFKLQPYYLLRMSWIKDSLEHVIFYDQMNAEVFEDSVEIKLADRMDAAKQQAAAAEYVFFQPFKLLLDNATLEYVGQTKLFDSLPVKEVAVRYPDETSTDQWSYFFNNDYQLTAAKVAHEDRISLILNTSFQKYEGILLNKTRVSYFVDSLGQKLYTRATYNYDIVD